MSEAAADPGLRRSLRTFLDLDHPRGLALAEDVLPILRKHGVVQEEYEGSTFRENLGLPRP